METIPVNLKERSYDIIIGNNSIKCLGKIIRGLKLGNDAYIITNSTIKKIYGNILIKTLSDSGFNFKFKLIADTEKSKSLNTVSCLIQDLARYDRQKRVFIIAFGGGVIGDISGFIASIYKRGIPYIQAATTLLAQVDSSIGGKTGIDLKQGKNLVGAFYQPKLVFNDVAMLKTLDLRQIRTGMAEVIKYGIIKDPVLFDYLEKKTNTVKCDKFDTFGGAQTPPFKAGKDCAALSINPEQTPGFISPGCVERIDFEFIVTRCSRIKAKITAQDEKEESGIRTILNFGHTIGHAIEAAGSYKIYNHGEAVALGMLIAADISVAMGLLNYASMRRIERLIEKIGLPAKISKIPLKKIITSHYSDKKFTGKKNKFVLIKSIGKTKIVEAVPIEQITAALKKRYK